MIKREKNFWFMSGDIDTNVKGIMKTLLEEASDLRPDEQEEESKGE